MNYDDDIVGADNGNDDTGDTGGDGNNDNYRLSSGSSWSTQGSLQNGTLALAHAASLSSLLNHLN